MKRSLVLFSFFVLGVLMLAGTLQVQAQFGPSTPERQAAIAKQLALEEATPKLQITEEVLPLVIPGHTIGETEGVSKNSKGHLFVYSRTGTWRQFARRDSRGAVRVRRKPEIRQAVGPG